MSVTKSVKDFAAALSSPSQIERFVAEYGTQRVLVAIVTKRTKLTIGKDYLECFGLRLSYELLYRETLLALRRLLLRVDERGLFTSVNTAAVKLNHFTHDALLEKQLGRVNMALRVTRDCKLLEISYAVDPFLKVIYCRYCAKCLSTFRYPNGAVC